MSWKPHTLTTVEVVDPSPVAALSALLDSGRSTPVAGDPLPPLWHWVALPRWSPSSVLDADGHPRRGDFLPPLDLPRRMFAGGEVKVLGELRVASTVVRRTTVTSVQQKNGRTGPLGLVEVTTHLIDPASDDVLVEERQDILYREAAPRSEQESRPDPGEAARATPAGPPLVPADDGWRFVTDPTLLMRFSAATANAHRIHYDWPYTTRVEGYRGLVVHGPLSTLALAEAARSVSGDCRVVKLSHRNIAPVICGDDTRIVFSPREADHAEVVLQRPDGTRLSHLTLHLDAPTPKGTTHG